MLRQLSIRSKLLIAILMASFFTLAIETSVLIIWDNKNLEDAAVENAYGITQSLTQNFVKMLLLDSAEAASDTIETLHSFNTVKKVYFYDLKGVPIFQYHQTNDLEYNVPDISKRRAIEVGEDFIYILQPIYYDNKSYGKVFLVLSKDFIIQWKKTQQQRILIFSIAAIVLAFLFAKIAEPLITRPITKLANAMQKIESDHDFSQRVYTDERREIGQLYKGFNQMMSSVQTFSKDLQDHKYAIDQAAIISKTNVMGRITYSNEKFSEVSGYSKDELMGQNHRMIKSDIHDDEFYRDMWKTIAKGKVWNGEICNRAKDGSYYWVDSTIVPFLDEKGKPVQYMAIRYLITELKEADAKLNKVNRNLEKIIYKRTFELEEYNDRLLQSEKMASLGGLVAGIAHEINTPVGIGVTAASHLQEAVQNFSEKSDDNSVTKRDLLEFIDEAESSSRIILSNLERAALLIRSFKQVAVDQTAEEKRVFNMHEYLDEIFLSLRPQLKKTQHKVIIDCDEDLLIESYAGAFSQIITNFVSNSLRYAFEPDTAGIIKVTCSKDDERFYLEYSDNGRGVDEQALKKLFDPFYTTGRSIGGSGLGMHIVFNLVTQNLSGHIKAESDIGEGIKFSIDIPLKT